MSERNKATLLAANVAITQGDHEGFLARCAEDIVWSTVGEESLNGKQAVREWMLANPVEPPWFSVDRLVAEGDFVIALGHIDSRDPSGTSRRNAYADVWRFRDGLMVELRAFVIPVESA